ncbi:MAG: cytochrome c [Gammaproteobacteria bacterium]|jgi:cytochrome c5|nr:cytochrome c [Gammaproteobacteria bacterium]MBT4146496.1 cytochrome c [Gammaproteobacteria bacterium]MBT5223063.1 cytochrome c [Gammaproteobacteria bacterium]MBT5826275.1 cytochrome c [Gammaproteobacteria bacterium]MBT5966038.1 cytochrome c [Gammaproteobacteria bacterium]
MKKILLAVSTVALLGLSAQASAGNLKVGKKIYDRAFGRGCGACHDIASNPQLVALIKSGDLTKANFSTTLKEGKNGMPKAVDAIMAVGPVKKAGLSEDEAIDAVWSYLSQ